MSSPSSFRIGPNFIRSIGPHEVVLTSSSSNSQTILDKKLLFLLFKCLRFKSLDQHAKDIWRSLSIYEKRKFLKPIFESYYKHNERGLLGLNGFEKMLEELLRKFSEAGFLISKESFLKWVEGPAKSNVVPPPIKSVGVITKNRPQALEVGLSSYIQESIKWKRKFDFLIFDDSLGKELCTRNRELAGQMKKRTGVSILYAGNDEKKKFADALIRLGMPRHVIEFGLFADNNQVNTCGANRNAFLLHSVGDMVFSADDDTVCRIGKSPRQKESLQLGTVSQLFEEWRYETREAVLSDIPSVETDIMKAHEKLLGKSLGGSIREFGPELFDTETMTGDMMNLICKSQGKIVATFNGLIGDSGSGSSVPLIFSSGRDRERLLRSEKSYRTAFESREVCREFGQYIVERSWMGVCMAGFFGLDNRDIVPPFFPAYTREDALFGTLLQKCMNDSYFGYLPWELLHSPVDKRESFSDPVNEVWPFDIILGVLQNFNLGFENQPIATNLKLVGEHLMRFGSLPFAEYKEVISNHIRNLTASKILECEGLLQKYPKSPTFWVHDVKRLIEKSREEIVEKIILAPRFMVEEIGVEKAEHKVQNLVYKFGELLKWWPDIVQSAKDLKRKGIRLAQPV